MAQRGINRVTLIGNLGQEPSVHYTPNGTMACSLSVATSESWTDDQGRKQERTEWHRVVLWRGLAEIAQKFLKKGSRIYIDGKLRTRKYQKNGSDHYVTEIIGEEMQMLDRPQDGQFHHESHHDTGASEPYQGAA
jgi:single-strand DNA-binding protein